MEKIKRSVQWLISAVLFTTVLLTVSSCQEDDPKPSGITNEENAYVNDWIQENMEFWYLWNSGLPSAPDKNLAPDEFFESLLSSQDRFSWIQDNYQELLDALKGISKEAGYEFALYRESESSDNVIAQVLYVKHDSPADNAGLVRGDIISHINGTQITVGNYRELLDEIKEEHAIRFKSIDAGNQTVGEEKTLSLPAIVYSENPNYLNKIIDVNGRKIGYFVYNFFAGGADSESTAYDDEMDQVFAGFKAAGVTDLVLDLRFNSGGTETSANNLASLIGVGVNDTKIFAKREYNEGVEKAILDDPDLGSDFLTSEFRAKNQNIGTQLANGRVYVLTSSRTASASELVINALKPYMEVFIIGDVTYGKNVGSISLYEANDSRNKWGMQPIVVKIYNSEHQSDYANGFVPDILDEDNSLFIYPLGDSREALLRHAIEHITGVSTGGRQAQPGEVKELIGHSLDAKRSSFNLVIDPDFLK
jgi:carboxyl-terminal processing protease